MPTPIEVLLDPLSLSIFGMYLACLVWERARPARPLPEIRFWAASGLAAFLVYFFVATYLPLLWDATLARHQLFDLRPLGTVGGAVVAVLLYQVLFYAYHRVAHASPTVWRIVHQMHHSAERLDVLGAYYFGIAEMAVLTVLSSLVFVWLIGVTAPAATAALLTLTFLALFQHMNVRTPRWLGYIVQRPESHSVHHQRGLHDGNFSDLPLLDIVFGTFVNPRAFADETGFYDGASARVVDMLLGRDVSIPPMPATAAPTRIRSEAVSTPPSSG